MSGVQDGRSIDDASNQITPLLTTRCVLALVIGFALTGCGRFERSADVGATANSPTAPTVAVPQAPSCSYAVSPTSGAYGPSGGTDAVTVTTNSAGCVWTATSNAIWITIINGSSSSGSGTATYSVAANTTTTSRSGTLTVAGRTIIVTQQGSAGGTVRLNNGDSYHFRDGTRSRFIDGDFYYVWQGGDKFWANNIGQRGLIDLGNIGSISLLQVQPPTGGTCPGTTPSSGCYFQHGVVASVGHTYVSLAKQGEEGHFIVFRVTAVAASQYVELNYYYR